ncbi:MAG: HAD-IIB family hydrolase [SAR324 cluster bacterium]|nr:HAD-IIB family hydrolase [SAR324 cluster bacterium]
MSKFKLICFDLDGTLLDANFQLPKAHIETIETLKKRGYRISIATGRSYSSAKPYIDALNITEPMVFSNGSVYENPETGTREVLMGIPVETAKQVCALEEKEAFSLKVHLADGQILKSKDQAWPDEGVHFVVGDITENIKDILNIDPIKIVLHGTDEEMESFSKTLKAALGENSPVRLFRTHRHYVEITNAQVSKGQAVTRLINQLGIDKSEVVGVGDQENDIELVRDFGMGIQVGDNCDALKAVATQFLKPPEENGLTGLLDLLP